MTENIHFKEHYKQQGGRCFECAQLFPFAIEAYNFRTEAFHCQSCKEADLEKARELLDLKIEGTLPN